MMMRESYEISRKTMALLPNKDPVYQTKVIEAEGEYLCAIPPIKLIRAACLRGGASYEGRREAIIERYDYKHRTPIPVFPAFNVFAFPTTSPDNYECMWLFENHIYNVTSSSDKACINFHNGASLVLDYPYKFMRLQWQRTATCARMDVAFKDARKFVEIF
ncbi:competence protein ComK [Priestia koreensis]|nr:competence protein ComK [Priestia koreensis]